MLSTQERRKLFPKRYTRKDARNVCLRLAYGQMTGQAGAAHYSGERDMSTPERTKVKLPEKPRLKFMTALALAQWPQEFADRVLDAFKARMRA